MTLQEIFKSVRFDDMVKYLIDIESQVFVNLYCFKEAFGAFRKIPSPKYIFSTNNDRKNIRIDLLVFE